MWAIAKPWRNTLKSRCLKTLHCVLCAFYMKTAKDSKMNAGRAGKKKIISRTLSNAGTRLLNRCVCLFVFSHFHLSTPLWALRPLDLGGGLWQSGGGGGGAVGFLRAVRQKLQEIHFASFCLPLRARRTAVAWSTIAALIIFLRLGEGYCFFSSFIVRARGYGMCLYRARGAGKRGARSCRGCLGDMYHWSTTQGFLHAGQR